MTANRLSTTYTTSAEDMQTSTVVGAYIGCLIYMWYMATVGRSFTVYVRIRKSGNRTLYNDPVADYAWRAIAEWEAALEDIGREWKVSISGCILFIPLSIALLQIGAISQNVLARTAVIAACIFAIAGLTLGARLMAHLPQFRKIKCRNAWEKASRSCADLEFVEFWSLLAFPMAMSIWSASLCVMSVLIMAWTSQDVSGISDSHAKTKTVISASFLMVLAMTLAAFLYRCKQITKRLF